MQDLPFFSHEEQRFFERHQRRHAPKLGAGERRREARRRADWEHALEAQADARASEVTGGDEYRWTNDRIDACPDLYAEQRAGWR